MRRRDFLIRVCQPLILGVAAWVGGCASGRQRDDEVAELVGDLARLRGRDYSEVGVCMLLTGEDLHGDVIREQDLGGRRLAGILDQHARLLLAARPDATDDDVAALVELVAWRDFDAGGGEF